MTKISLCKKNCYSAPFFDEYFERNTFFFFNNTNDNTFYINVKTVQKKKKIKEENLKTDSGVLRILNNKTVMF